jgi:uroporphyrinogen-III synthase
VSSLANQIIISTRPISAEDSLKSQLQQKGAVVLDFPLIKICPFPLTDEIKNTLLQIDDYQWVAFTSKNGVKFFFQFLKELGIQKDALSVLKIAVVGKKTADEVLKNNCSPSLISSGNNSLDLANELAEVLKPSDNILLPLAELADDTMINRLGALANVSRLNVYQTKDEEQIDLEIVRRIIRDDYSIILFTSPSGFRHFHKIMIANNITSNIRAACMGTTTEKEMLLYNCTPILVSSRSDSESFATQLEHSLKNL